MICYVLQGLPVQVRRCSCHCYRGGPPPACHRGHKHIPRAAVRRQGDLLRHPTLRPPAAFGLHFVITSPEGLPVHAPVSFGQLSSKPHITIAHFGRQQLLVLQNIHYVLVIVVCNFRQLREKILESVREI